VVLNGSGRFLATNRGALAGEAAPQIAQHRACGRASFFSCPAQPNRPQGCGAGEHCLACGTFQAVTQSQAGRRTVEQECLLISGDAQQTGQRLELNVRASQVDIDGKDYTVVFPARHQS